MRALLQIRKRVRLVAHFVVKVPSVQFHFHKFHAASSERSLPFQSQHHRHVPALGGSQPTVGSWRTYRTGRKKPPEDFSSGGPNNFPH
jgi:hypothetical protein